MGCTQAINISSASVENGSLSAAASCQARTEEPKKGGSMKYTGTEVYEKVKEKIVRAMIT
jgi:hypothetical protein